MEDRTFTFDRVERRDSRIYHRDKERGTKRNSVLSQSTWTEFPMRVKENKKKKEKRKTKRDQKRPMEREREREREKKRGRGEKGKRGSMVGQKVEEA